MPTSVCLQRDARRLRIGILVSDIVWLVVSLLLLCIRRHDLSDGGMLTTATSLAPVLVIAVSGWCVIYFRYRLDGFCRGWRAGKTVSEMVIGVALVAGLLSAAAYILDDSIPRILIASYCTLLATGFLFIRFGCRVWMTCLRARPRRRLIIVDNGRVAAELSSKFEDHSEMRCKVMGFLYPKEVQSGTPSEMTRIAGVNVPDMGIVGLLREKEITDVVIGPSVQSHSKAVLSLTRQCREVGVRVSIVPQTYTLYDSLPNLVDVDGLPILELQKTFSVTSNPAAKRAFDVIVVALACPILLPLLALVALYCKLRSGKVLARELRCGRGGAPFFMHRFNLGTCLSDQIPGLLKDLSITELPQMWNVLRGEMSIVGPRPETPERVQAYSEWQRQRLSVRPGLTGLAQVHGLREKNTSEEKARFDLEYIACWSVFTDCILVLETVWILLKRLASASRLHGVERLISAKSESPC